MRDLQRGMASIVTSR